MDDGIGGNFTSVIGGDGQNNSLLIQFMANKNLLKG